MTSGFDIVNSLARKKTISSHCYSDTYLKGTVVNQTCNSQNGGTLEKLLTVTFKDHLQRTENLRK